VLVRNCLRYDILHAMRYVVRESLNFADLPKFTFAVRVQTGLPSRFSGPYARVIFWITVLDFTMKLEVFISPNYVSPTDCYRKPFLSFG
jgi:hypothetical protein